MPSRRQFIRQTAAFGLSAGLPPGLSAAHDLPVHTARTVFFVGGVNASDHNPGTASAPFATIQAAAHVAQPGDVVKIRDGIYRETVVPANSGKPDRPIAFEADEGAEPVISGADLLITSWQPASHPDLPAGNPVYEAEVALPVTGYVDASNGNTDLLANQIFVRSKMMPEARWPKMTDTDDPMKDHAYTRVLPGWVSGQNASGVVTWNAEGNFKNRVNDPEIPDIPGGWTGGRITLLIYNNTFGTPEGGTPEQPLRMMGANTCQLNLTQYKDAPQSINNNIYMNRQFENAMALRASELAIGREKLDPSTVFVDPTGRSGGLGFQLKAGSPAINRGVPVNGTMDATGKPIDYVDNFDGPAPDCGAYEFGKEPWVPGCNLSKEFIEGQPWERQWSPKRIQ